MTRPKTNEVDKWTDDEVVEHLRQQMQDAVDRAAEVYREGGDPEDFFAKEKADLKHDTAVTTAFAHELREVGAFLLDFPRDFITTLVGRKHWVYERVSDGTTFVLSLATRTQLQRRGYVSIHALLFRPGRLN